MAYYWNAEKNNYGRAFSETAGKGTQAMGQVHFGMNTTQLISRGSCAAHPRPRMGGSPHAVRTLGSPARPRCRRKPDAQVIRPIIDLGLTLVPEDGGEPIALFKECIVRIEDDTARVRC